jgi:gamma-D-glutamyl-L-lysine dipeptidyl-peptidase
MLQLLHPNLSRMKFGIVLHSLVPIRKEPQEESEMVSQLVFGEGIRVISENDGWTQIITQFDDYPGWIDSRLYREIKYATFNGYQESPPKVLDSLIMSIEKAGSRPRLILAGSNLPGYNRKKDTLVIEDEVLHIRSTFSDFNSKELQEINKTAGYFLNAPYLWGGRSIFGCDCSGFIQMVYKIHGIPLKRDSSQQAKQGEAISSLTDARLGDLAFFANTEGKVYHVGLILSPMEIVHSSGYVHIDRLDETGIYNLETQQYTHRLFSIRRVADVPVARK